MQALYVVPAKVKAAEVCFGEIEALYGAVLEISRPLEEYSVKGGLILKSGVAKFDISIELRLLEAGIACESCASSKSASPLKVAPPKYASLVKLEPDSSTGISRVEH